MTTQDSSSPTPEPPKKTKKPKQPGRWRRRTIWALSILVIVLFVLRGALPLALPVVMQKVAGVFGLTCDYDRMELNLFSGDAGIWGLEFKPKEGGSPILTTDYCHGNVSVLNLFRGKLNVWRIEADGVDINLDRNPDGHIPLRDRFIAATSKSNATPATVTTPTNPSTTPVNLASPLRVDALRLSHIRVHIHDKGVTPEVDTELAMDLRLSDLGSTSQPAKFEMNLSADSMLDSMKITGQGTSGGKNLDASFDALIRGIRLKPATAYLAPLGIRPVSDGITLRAQGRIQTSAAPNGTDGFTGSIAFDHLAAIADGEEALALDHLKVDAGVIDTKSIHFNSIILDGARATAGRAVDGNLQVAGIEYDPSLVAKPTAAAPPPTAASSPSPILLSLLAERWSVGEIALRNAKLQLSDQGIAPPVDLSFFVDELAAKSIDHDPKNPDTKVTLTGLLHAPGLIKQIKIDGSATPFADSKKFSATVDVTGIKPDAIKPYLDHVGLESTLKDGHFEAALDASMVWGDTITSDFNMTQCDYSDGDDSLVKMNAVKVKNVSLDTKSGRIGVSDIEISGPGLSALRDSSAQLSAFGFRTKPIVATASAVAVPAPAGSPQAASMPTIPSLPKITVEKFGWHDVHLDLEDDTVTPPVGLAITNVGVEASDITTDLTATKPGHFKAFLDSPRVAKNFELDGNLTPRSDGLNLDATVTGTGLDTAPFATYLKPFGIEPILRDGGLTAHAAADVTQNKTGLSASLGLDHVRYTDGDSELAAVDSVNINGLSIRDGGLNVDSIQINRPRASARRDADGSLIAGGIRVLPPQPVNPNAPASVATIAPPTTAPLASTQPTIPFVVMLKKLSVTDSNIDWNDLALQPAVSTSAGASLEIDNITIGRDADPATLNLTAHATGSADNFAVTGKLVTSLTSPSASLDISANGLRVGPLLPYLPPGVGSSLKDGQFHTTIDAALSQNPAGGIGAKLIVGPLTFNDGGDSLFQLDSVRVIVPRIDLPLNALAVEELSVSGIQTHAERTASGELTFMGLLVNEKNSGSPAPVVVPTTAPAIVVVPPPLTTGPTAAELIAASHRVLPTVTVDKLNLNVAKLTLTDLSRPESSPLIVSDLRLHNVNRIDWLGKDAAAKPPTHLNFTCRVSPLVDQVMVDAMVSPFARNPNVQVDFSATGVHGDGLTKLVPELKNQVDGSTMDNGVASGHLEAEAKLDRRSPIDFDVSHGFDFTFDLTKVQYRAQPDGPVLAGVDEVKSENIRIAPADSLVHFKTLEIDKPIGFIMQDVKGVHALGWVYKLSTTQPVATTQSTVVVKSHEPTTLKPVDQVAAAPLKGEVRIDKLLIDGLDFRVEDNAVTPPMVIPLNGLDVEVRNISSRSPYEDKPIRFSAIVNADKVKLHKRGSQEFENRDLFSQITANGEVSLYPKLHGWAKTSVSGLDLASLQGPAKELGENLTNGVYDSTVDLRFDPTGAVAITSKFTLTDLSLSEPPNGLIYRTLHLPAPLDVAIGAVQGADGSIVIAPPPIKIQMDQKQLPIAQIGGAAGEAVARVILTAITAAPLKAANDVGGLIGLSGGAKPTEEPPTTIPFAPGSIAVGPNQFSDLVPLLKKLHKDDSLTVTIRHELGDGDITIASVRANPTPEQCRNLESQLRSRKAELLQLRASAAGQARAQLVSLGAKAAQPALDHLRAIDRELAGNEESLDQVGELLKPGAARLSERRTRTAALQLATDRMSAIQSVIIAQGISADRVKTVTAKFDPQAGLDGGEIMITAVERK